HGGREMTDLSKPPGWLPHDVLRTRIDTTARTHMVVGQASLLSGVEKMVLAGFIYFPCQEKPVPHPPLLLRSLFVLTALTLLSACGGSPGPAGGQGPAGVQGPEGPLGEPGSVNMFYSPWISFQGGQWNQVTEFGRITQLYDITEGLVTQDVID